MKKIIFVFGLIFVLIAVCVFAETEKVISQKNEYGGETVEDNEGLPGTGLYRVVTYYDQKGKTVKVDYYHDGKSRSGRHKTTKYLDRNGTMLFREHFDKNGSPLQDSAGYRYLNTLPDGDFYYRINDISDLPDNRIRVWCKVILTKGTISELAVRYEGGVANGLSHLESLYEIDYKARKVAMRSVRFYDKANHLIDIETIKENALEWESVSPGTIFWELYHILSGRKR